jgi:hypothetical protein
MTPKEALHRLTHGGTVQTFVAKVKAIDEVKMTCDVSVEGTADLFDVRLRSVIDSAEKGILIYPKIGTYVLVGIIDGRKTSAFVAATSEVDKIRLMSDVIELSGNSLGGIVKADELKTQLDKMTARIDGIIDAITNGVPVTDYSGAGLQSSIVLALQTLIDIENFNHIKNDKVKHG